MDKQEALLWRVRPAMVLSSGAARCVGLSGQFVRRASLGLRR